MQNSTNISKLYQLDALRGIASVIVFFWHFLIGYYPSITGHFDNSTGLIGTPLFAFINGAGAVIFFFVLSGFILTKKYYEEDKLEILTIAAFKRYFRLTGPILLSVLISFILISLNYNHNFEASIITNSTWLSSMLDKNFEPNLLIAVKQGIYGALVGGDVSYNTNLWTMSVEFYGSFIVFAIAPLFKHSNKNQFILLFVILIKFLLGINPYYIAFIFGTTLSLLLSKYKTIKINKYICLICFIFGILLFAYKLPIKWYSFLDNPFIQRHNPDLYLNVLASCIFITLFMTENKITKFLSGKFGKLLGEISFPLYLSHLIVIITFSSIFLLYFSSFISNYNVAILLTFIGTVIVTGIFVLIITKFENYWIPLVNNFSKKVSESEFITWITSKILKVLKILVKPK